jgi:hypothetical protein
MEVVAHHASLSLALRSDGSEDAPAGLAVLSSGGVVGVNGVGLSSTIVVGVDGIGRAGAELDVELCPAKEFEYCFERRPYTSRSALRA